MQPEDFEDELFQFCPHHREMMEIWLGAVPPYVRTQIEKTINECYELKGCNRGCGND